MSIEDLISQEARRAIQRVSCSEDWSFNALVDASNLRPSCDFRYVDLRGLDLRGADLRGFDLTGADLRGCLKDEQTKIDQTTLLIDAELDWLDIGRTPIVEKMFAIENASSSRQRHKLMGELVTQYTSDRHTHQYFRNLVRQTNSVELFFDVLEFFEPQSDSDRESVSKGLIKFALKTSRRVGARKPQQMSTISFSGFLDRIKSSPNRFLSSLFVKYLEESAAAGRVSLNPNRYEVTEGFTRLISALEFQNSSQSSMAD